MNRIVRPVRAWAEYDEWSCYIEDDFDGEKGKPFWIWWYPKTGDGAAADGGVDGIVDGLGYSDQMVCSGPLRSLRVLYENGHELHVATYENVGAYYDWWVSTGETVVARGDFEEDRDSEAVERAMIAASAWFTQHDPALVK